MINSRHFFSELDVKVASRRNIAPGKCREERPKTFFGVIKIAQKIHINRKRVYEESKKLLREKLIKPLDFKRMLLRSGTAYSEIFIFFFEDIENFLVYLIHVHPV